MDTDKDKKTFSTQTSNNFLVDGPLNDKPEPLRGSGYILLSW